MFGVRSENGYTEILEGIRVKTLNYGSESLMSEFLLRKDAQLPEHAHLHEQCGYLVSGHIVLHVDGLSRDILPGDSWNISSNVKHRADIIEDSVALEIFSPLREDYKKFAHAPDIV